MSSARTVMIGTGGALVLLAVAGGVGKLADAAFLPAVNAIPSAALYVTVGSMALIGVLLVAFAPPSRRDERRVRLDEVEAIQHTVLRPSAQGGLPHTSGMANAYAAAASGAKREGAPEPPPPSSPPPEPPPKAPMGPPPPSTRAPAAHPNDAAADPHPAAPTPEPPGPAQTPEPPVVEKAEARRNELRERLELLDQKANNAKVRYGLGKISAAGYRQYLKEVDQERTLIESELMEADAE